MTGMQEACWGERGGGGGESPSSPIDAAGNGFTKQWGRDKSDGAKPAEPVELSTQAISSQSPGNGIWGPLGFGGGLRRTTEQGPNLRIRLLPAGQAQAFPPPPPVLVLFFWSAAGLNAHSRPLIPNRVAVALDQMSIKWPERYFSSGDTFASSHCH